MDFKELTIGELSALKRSFCGDKEFTKMGKSIDKEIMLRKTRPKQLFVIKEASGKITKVMAHNYHEAFKLYPPKVEGTITQGRKRRKFSMAWGDATLV